MNEFMGARRFAVALDDILPPWHNKGCFEYTWTSPRGLFTIKVTPRPSDEATFWGATWRLTVPLTVSGLDALVTVMVLAGAIELPTNPYRVEAVGATVRVRPYIGKTVLFHGSAADAFSTGVALIEAAGHVATWRNSEPLAPGAVRSYDEVVASHTMVPSLAPEPTTGAQR